jgi:LysM repeat protein
MKEPTMHSTSRTAPAVRLTRRGRAALVLLLAALLFATFSLGRSATGTADATPAGSGAQVEQTTVQAGESLWSVARRIAPENDPREVIEQIRRLNGLAGSQIHVGQQLLLPGAA